MGVLDRLRGAPPWQHPDAHVRAAAVAELPADAQPDLIVLAREDPAPEVRRAAVRRLRDPDLLAAIAREDAHPDVAAEAAAALLELALRGPDEATAHAALAKLSASRDLVEVARSSIYEGVSHAALERVDDPRALAMLARRASQTAIRLAALARVEDPDELVAVAVRSEEKDVALAALERLRQARSEDRDTFHLIALRARNRVVARRAKAIVRLLDARPRPPDPAEFQVRRTRLTALVEHLAQATDPEALQRELAAARAAWAALVEQAAPSEEETARFVAAAQAAEQRLSTLLAEQAERARREQARHEAVAARVALCEAVERLQGAETPAQLEAIRAAWAALAPIPDDEGQGDALARRFERAVAACEHRYARWQAAEQRRTRMRELLREGEALLDLPDLRTAKIRWAALKRQWSPLIAAADPDAPEDAALREGFDRLAERLRLREAEERDAQLRAQQENYARLQRLAAEVEALLGRQDLTLKEAESALRDLRAAVEDPGVLPSRRDREEIEKRLKRLLGELAPRVRDLRELEQWQRWANLAVQEELCKRLEALRESQDVPAIARALRETLAEWRKVRRAPKAEAEPLWQRFKTVYDELRARCREYFAQQAAERQGNLKLKLALCEQAEALAESTDWVRTAQHFERLQAEWKQIGPVPREHAQAVWQRFRAACEKFYARRKADLAQRKQEWAKNLERKEALCARAEALAESTDWEQAAAEIRRLQAEWKTIGPVKKSKSEAVWQRFRTACDRFFERYRQREQIAWAAASADREAIVRELEQLLPAPDAPPPEPPADLVARVQQARARWQQAPPLPREQARALDARLTDVILRLVAAYPAAIRGSELDPAVIRKRMEKLCARVEALVPADVVDETTLSPAELLARKWREALAAKQLGVRVDEEAKWRAATDEVRQAQAAWKRLGPLPGEEGERLSERFQRACQRFFEARDRRRRAASAR